MGLSCLLGRHRVLDRGVRNRNHEFARCQHCRCDLIRSGSRWKPIPKGYKVVWRPRSSGGAGAVSAGDAAIGREVDLKGVTVIGERSYGSQRFALVILNAKDERSYKGSLDQLGTSGAVAAQMGSGLSDAVLSTVQPKTAPGRVTDFLLQEPREESRAAACPAREKERS